MVMSVPRIWDVFFLINLYGFEDDLLANGRKKEVWFSAVKKALISIDSKDNDKKSSRIWVWEAKKCGYQIGTIKKCIVKNSVPPQSPPPTHEAILTKAENEQSQHAYSVAYATAVAAEAAVAAAHAAAEVVRLTSTTRLSGKSTEEIAAVRIQTAYRGHLEWRANCVRCDEVRRLTSLVKAQKNNILQQQLAMKPEKTQATLDPLKCGRICKVCKSDFSRPNQSSLGMELARTWMVPGHGNSKHDGTIIHRVGLLISYMAATKSTRARSRMASPVQSPSPLGSGRKGTSEKGSAAGSAKKRLSFTGSPARTTKRFIGVKDANVFVKTLSNIWIGSYHIFITPAINQRSNPITNPKPQTTNPTQSFNNPSIQNAFPILTTNVTKNTIPATKAEQPKPNTNPSHTNQKRIITFNDQDLINVINTDSILLVKLKDIDSMSNMYTICRNEGFSDLNIHHVGGYWIWIQFPSSSACSKFQENESLKKLYSVKRAPSSNFTVDERILWIEISGLPLCAWGSNAYKKIACSFGKFLFFEKEDSSALSSGRVCISSKSHGLISENVQVEINNELFEATVQEIGSWCIKITDDYIDLSSNDNIKDVDTSSESIDDHSVDDLEYIQTNLNNIVNQVSEQKMDNNEENKQGEEDIHLIVPQQPPKEEANNKESNPECKAESSDLSRPPGFEFMKKSSSPSSKCSTSFARFRKKDIKGVSLIHELNQIIDVGNSLGYDVRVWLGVFWWSHLYVGPWKNVVGDCYMVNIYGPQDQVSKLALWNRLQDFMLHHNGSYIMFEDMNVVRNEQERVGSIFNNIEADYFNSFINATGLVDLCIGGRCFTWMNKACTNLSKLDRFLISKDVIDLLPDIRITVLDRIWSDHNPILLHVDKINFGPSSFKLYNSWLLRDGFDDLIKSEWDSLDFNNFEFPIKCHEKFCILKAKIRQWNNNNKTMERNRKAAALDELSSIEKKIDEGSALPVKISNRHSHSQVTVMEEKLLKCLYSFIERRPIYSLT
ncbi:RNA-directed DNA polymerase, eukaryota, reverse transcriptase zinc-binding domain protein [Tanacetum coccineum]